MKSRILAVGLAVVIVAAAVSAIALGSQHHGARAALSTAAARSPLTGGQVRTVFIPRATRRTKGCAALPHACGFPDTTNSGITAGTVLREVPGQVSSGPGWHFNRRGWVQVDGDGAVLRGLSIPYPVNVAASNVTIRSVRIEVSGNKLGISLRHARNTVIEDSDIYGPSAGRARLATGIKDVFGNSTGTRILGDDIWHTGTGIQVESGLIADNYIHNPGFRAGDHINGITSNGGKTAQLTIQHNTILIGHDQTDAIGLFEDFGIQAKRLVEDNLLAGGGYTIYAGQMAGKPATYDIKILHNRISRIYYPGGGYYGAADLFDSHGRGNVWTGNTFSGNSWKKTDRVVAHP